MPDITKGKTFSSGDTVTAADLNSLLDDAVINNNAITNSKIADGAVDNATVSGTAGIDFSKLASLSTGQVLAGNGGTPTATTVSGDVTIAADGAVSIADDAVTQAKIADDAVGADQLADGAVDGAAIAMGSDAQGDILYYDGTSYVRLGAGTSGQLLQSGGTGANPSWVSQSINPSVPQVDFKDSGTSGTFTVPSGVTRVKVSVQGAGGTGYNSNWSSSSAYIGAGGAYFEKTFSVTAGDTISYSAAAVTGNNSANQKPSGASSTITYDSTTYTAGGGAGGYSTGQNAQGGTVTGTVDISVNGKDNGQGGHAGSGSLTKYGNGGYSDYNYSTATGQGGYVKFEY